MTEEMKMLLKLMLAQEEENQKKDKKTIKVKNVPEFVEDIESDKGNKKRAERVQKQYLEADVSDSVRAVHGAHEAATTCSKDIPVWAKYALSVPEAAQYFHIGRDKLREIINHDKYADFLIWNGGRVFIKRKLFEEFLDKSNSI